MRVLLLVILVSSGVATMRASAQSDNNPVYFTYFDAKTDAVSGKMDCDLGFLVPDDAQLRMTLHMKDGVTEIGFSYQATRSADLIVTAQPPKTESVTVSMTWPNSGDRATVVAHGFLLPTAGAVDETFRSDAVDAGLLYQLANSGSNVSIRFSGSRGDFDAALPQKGLNGLQRFTSKCL
ncbi:MAG: hypothetical protein P8Y02_14810 [Deinococcales bacterium]